MLSRYPQRPEWPDATELRRQMEAGDTTALHLVRASLDRLHTTHARINGATHLFEARALEEARQPRPGPLSGIPISVKETFGLDGETVTAGSVRMPPQTLSHAVAVQRLQEAGAIVIARSNVPEFAMTGETTNLRFGRTNNCLNSARTAGGSSGGEGALVGSGATVMGLGSDILGSIRIPACFNGVVGFKPASHAVPKDGMWPDLGDLFVGSLLAVGPLTRSVRDARLMYNVIAYAALPNPRPVRGTRLIVPRPFHMTIRHRMIEAALAGAETVLAHAGLVCEYAPFADVPTLYEGLSQLIGFSFERPLRALLTTADGERLSKSAELVRQLRGQPTVDPGLFRLLSALPLVRPKLGAVHAIIERVKAARRRTYRLLGDDGVLLLPTMGMLAPRHGEMNRLTLQPGVSGEMTPMTFCNLMNLPAITVPAWGSRDRATGLVPGVMLACAPGAEATLLDVAEVMEAGI